MGHATAGTLWMFPSGPALDRGLSAELPPPRSLDARATRRATERDSTGRHGTARTAPKEALTRTGRQAAAWVASNARTGSRPTTFLSVEMVMAEGRIVRAGEHENPDLLWRLRGAGTEVSCKTQLKGTRKWQKNRRKQKI